VEEGYTSMQGLDISLGKKEKRGDRKKITFSTRERIERMNKPTCYLFIFSRHLFMFIHYRSVAY